MSFKRSKQSSFQSSSALIRSENGSLDEVRIARTDVGR
ncbi:hypothetical protein [Sporisorium scitamineum]|uniref:Uncharacterized protein n=1 Tax=Sporisorium scitamineum TaxID=49012 RepID=A0A0F7SC31_9BASI|nr:hypothetical protein [Sporisorium scitamineum]